METKLIEGVPPLANDKEILALLAEEHDPNGPSGKAMDIALLGSDGRLYRTVRAWGLGEYLGIAQGLEGLGLTNTGRALKAHGIRFDDVFSG
ncbi:hypothetical protein [Methylibium sp. Root1272]|uniref:hypothetical protein n=1 Tax=Methylibium sp. Root1272 TaxID=1736441 RepID=UPI0006F4EB25|nr:hypothetical protein [Methylibium sp. Root1272]KQW76599.1 hypothetical protein ASC67_02805 [Methylibium sp. Root1272]